VSELTLTAGQAGYAEWRETCRTEEHRWSLRTALDLRRRPAGSTRPAVEGGLARRTARTCRPPAVPGSRSRIASRRRPQAWAPAMPERAASSCVCTGRPPIRQNDEDGLFGPSGWPSGEGGAGIGRGRSGHGDAAAAARAGLPPFACRVRVRCLAGPPDACAGSRSLRTGAPCSWRVYSTGARRAPM
jgi:hypothetical protein